MRITRWHYGKIIMLWAWGAVVVIVSFQVLGALDESQYIFGTIVVVVAVAVPLSLSAITWIWLGGREKAND